MDLGTILLGLGKEIALLIISEIVGRPLSDSLSKNWDNHFRKNQGAWKIIQQAFKKSINSILHDYKQSSEFASLVKNEQELIVIKCKWICEEQTISTLLPFPHDTSPNLSYSKFLISISESQIDLSRQLFSRLESPILEGLNPHFLRYLEERILRVFLKEFSSMLKNDEETQSQFIFSILTGISVNGEDIKKKCDDIIDSIDETNRHLLNEIQESKKEIIREIKKNKQEDSSFSFNDVIPNINRHVNTCIKSFQKDDHLFSAQYLVRNIQNDIEEWIRTNDTGFAVVVGESGVGKSNLLCKVCETFFSDEDYATLIFKAEDFLGVDFSDAILKALGFDHKPLNLDDIFRYLSEELNKKIVVFLDTLDLVAYNHGPIKLRNLLTTLQKYNALLIGSSRPSEYNEITEMVVKKFSLSPLSDLEIISILQIFSVSDEIREIILHNDELREICRNPLHLKLFLITIEDKPNDYSNFRLQNLFQKYWAKKVSGLRQGITLVQNITKTNLVNSKIEIINEIALEGYRSKNSIINKNSIANIKNNTLYEYAYNDLISEGVIKEYNGKIQFFHQSFWEFCVAKVIIEKNLIDEIISQTWYPLFVGVFIQMGLQLSDDNSMELKSLINGLHNAPLISKIALVEIYLGMKNEFSQEKQLLEDYMKKDFKLIDYILGLIIYQGGRHSFKTLITLIQDFCTDPHWEIRRRITEALPNIIRINPEFALKLMKILRNDYDIARMRTDVRRRVIEALPSLFLHFPLESIELAELQWDDEIFTVLAIVEFLAGLPSQYDNIKNEKYSSIINKIPTEHARPVKFTWELQLAIRNNVEKAMNMVFENQINKDALIKIEIARSLPQFLQFKEYAFRALELMKIFTQPNEDKQVRRAISKGTKEIIGFLSSNFTKGNLDIIREIFLTLAVDKDDLIRRTICDNFDELIEVDPLISYKIVTEYFVIDDNSYVISRSKKWILRLINYFPEKRENLCALIELSS